jgi:transcriptional regulator with XRE-family HTH domain
MVHVTLSEFLKERQIRQSDFASQIGRSAAYVSMLCNGQLWPSRDTLLRIEAATDGRVTPNDFLRDHKEMQSISSPLPETGPEAA